MSSNRAKRKAEKNAKHQIIDQIPYILCYEGGIFEVKKGQFSKCFMLSDAEYDNIKDLTSEEISRRFSRLLCEIDNRLSVQFVIHNKLISTGDFLKRVLIKKKNEASLDSYIEKYNRMIKANSSIGHNNVKKTKYFVISINCDTADEAKKIFTYEEENINRLFLDVCGIRVRDLSSIEVLGILEEMYNPLIKESKVLNFSALSSIKRKKLTTKELIKPEHMENGEIDYLILNKNTYVRTLYISSIPRTVSNNLISDITNISSNMIFSCIYEPIDTHLASEIALRRIGENTIVSTGLKKDTLKDRKLRTTFRQEQMVKFSEEAYFDKVANKTLEEGRGMLCSFVIALFADDYETLKRDTKLLHISTSKFACQVKVLDLQQKEGLASVLPLCANKVNCKRMLSSKRLSSMPPLNLSEILLKDGLFNGLNAINDNLILLNRKNNLNPAGIIAGTEHSGKTFQCKREIFNALLLGMDRIYVVSNTNEYSDFAKKLSSRVKVYEEKDVFKCVDLLNEIYEKVKANKRSGITSWVFIDSMDEFFMTEELSIFLYKYIRKIGEIGGIFTMVIQSSVKLFTETSTALRLADLLNLFGYFKFLNQGAIERQKYADILNIPNALINYITGAELGKGIILTSASNMAFDDNFISDGDEGEEFYRLFH